MASRRSNYDLAYGDDYESRGGQRWDRDRFERTRARSRGPPGGRESFRFEETDKFGPRGGRRDIEIDDRYENRGPRGSRVEERDRFFEEDRYYTPRKSRPEFLEEDRYRSSGKELAPYKNRFEEPEPPKRPGFARRQSSWDAHDRRPIPRYDDRDDRGHEDLKVSVRVGSPPSKSRYEESRYDDRRYEDEQRYSRPEPERRDYEDYRDSRIIRERELQIDRRAPRGYRETEERESYEEVDRGPRRPPGMKKGKTRMPKRLVHKRAIVELGYPFEEEEDFYVVRLALGKDHIDECIKISETYKEEEKTTYRFEETRQLEAPPPPASSHHSMPPDSFHNEYAPPPPPEVIETVTTKVIENPTPSEYGRYASGHGGEDAHSDHTIHGGSDHGGHGGGGHGGSVHESFHERESVHGSVHGGSVHRGSYYGGHAPSKAPSHGGGHLSVKSPSPSRSRARSKSTKRDARSKSRKRSKSRAKSRRRSARFEEVDFEESASLTGPLGLIVPDRTRRKERDIKSEIRQLEAEKKALKYEREAEEKRKKYERKAEKVREEEGSGEERDVVRVEKDRRGRLNLVRHAD